MKEFRLPKIYTFIRGFMFSSVNKEFLIFLFFLALSGGFWLLATLNETYEKDFYVPVHITNIPKNVVITTNEEDTVRVTLKDKGFTIMAYLYSHKLQPVLINYGSYARKKAGKGVVPVADIQKQLYSQLYSSTKIVGAKPDKVEFYFNYGESKRVPIRMFGNVVPGERRYLAGYSFMPDYVTVYANKHMLDSIKVVYTEELNIINFNDTIVTTVSLSKIPGVRIEPAQVKMALYPDILTEEAVEVIISSINMPEGKVLRTFPSKVKVHFTVGVNVVRSIKPENFKVVVNYDELAAKPSEKCTLHLVNVPRGVKNSRLEISQVDYLIEQK